MGKYEEALERAKEIYNAPVATIVTRTFLEQIFPELKESEDERTRKELIHFILYKAGQLLNEETEHKFVVYLEKQKEQESTESSENEKIRRAIGTALCGTTAESILDANGVKLTEALSYLEKKKEQKPAARENDFVSNPQTSVEILRHYLVWAGNSESEEDCPYTWRALADAIRDGIKALEEQKPTEWSEEYREEDLRTRFAFYTYKDEDSALYLSNVFVEETSRNKGFGAKILAAAEKVAETLGAIQIRLKVKQNSPANAWYRKHGYGYMTFEDEYDWLEKTLEYLKPSWKPSEEQMEALMLAIEGKCPPTSYMSRRLEELYEVLANTYKVECKLEN